MNQLLLKVITLGASIPLSVFILKLIFKNSIMFKLSSLTVAFAIYLNLVGYLQGYYQDPNSDYYLTPINFIIGTTMFIYIRNSLTKSLQNSINHVKQLSEGNLSIDITESKSKTELGILNNSVLALTKSLKEILSEIRLNMNNLIATATELSKSSEMLSQGSNEQASAVEEVSATMEEIGANISQNTENAQITAQISNEANEGINEVSDRSGKAMEASKMIANKISIINDIAFQTNLLALNAAVEAARAGEQGRGFAVVATEVRKLAERSKIAAEEIVYLAEHSLELTNNAGVVMQENIPKIEKTTLLVQEITSASIEQNNGVNQVNNALQQLNTITQQNASSSEELAASAEMLKHLAEKVQEIVDFFKDDTLKTDFQKKATKTHIPVVNQVEKKSTATEKKSELKKDLSPPTNQKKEIPTSNKSSEEKSKGITINLTEKISDADFEDF